MRTLSVPILSGIVVLMLAACTIPLNQAAQNKSRVIISSLASVEGGGRAALLGRLPGTRQPDQAVRHQTKLLSGTSRAASERLTPRPNRIATRPSARDLAADTDVASLTYAVSNLNPEAGEESFGDSLDPSNPYLDLWLTPGNWYRIVVDVVPTASAPGVVIGVARYGDQTDFYVPDDGSTVYVDLFVHPTQTPIFDPTTLSQSFSPETGSPSAITIFNTPPTIGPMDKFFYGPDPKLYYFNETAGALYLWDDISVAMNSATPYYANATEGLTIYAAAADPYYSDTVWLLANDGTDVGIYYLDTSAAVPQALLWLVVTGDVTQGLLLSNTRPTGIAVDLPGNFYVSFYTDNLTTEGYSGVVEYDRYGDWIGQDIWEIYDATWYYQQESWATDVAVNAGNVYLTVNLRFPDGTGYVDLWGYEVQYDGYSSSLNRWWTGSPLASTYPAGTPLASANPNDLWAPAKFLGFDAQARVYLSQYRWDGIASAGWIPQVSRTALDLSNLEDL